MMVRGVADRLRALVRKRSEQIPMGITWSVLLILDAILIVGGVIATLQRPTGDLPVELVAFLIALLPALTFVIST